MDFLLELASEEIPARMQARAAEQLALRFGDGLKGRVPFDSLTTYVTPRRLALYVEGLGASGSATAEERRGPRADAPAAAIDGFLRSTGLTREQLEERDTAKGRFLYATIASVGRPAADLVAELVPAIVRDFDWPKSMRWGAASASTASPRWVRPLTGIVALLDGDVVAFEAAGIASGRTTMGHRFMAPGPVELAHARDYAAALRAAFVIVDAGERRSIIAAQAAAAARAAGLTLIDDAGLLDENAGLTEWPVPLLGRFDAAFLAVPREIIQLTMRTNQKYFACAASDGDLAPAFVAVANLAASDGGAAIVAGNQRVLGARLSDAKFFWDQDVAKVRAGGLEAFTPKLADIIFHEKLGTVADKVARVAKLARWLVDSGAVPGADPDHAELAARLCKADLTTATVGEFPELQGVIGGYLARVPQPATADSVIPAKAGTHLPMRQEMAPRFRGDDIGGVEPLPQPVADAIRDHYKPLGPSDTVPTAPVTVAVALADKLDTLIGFFGIGELPTGSRDPFALRRAAAGTLSLLVSGNIALKVSKLTTIAYSFYASWLTEGFELALYQRDEDGDAVDYRVLSERTVSLFSGSELRILRYRKFGKAGASPTPDEISVSARFLSASKVTRLLLAFLADRLKVQQREAGVRHDLIDAVFALGGEDDLVRLLARVHALQAFVATADGANLLAGYRRAANILRDEEKRDGVAYASDPGASLDKYIGETEKNLARLFAGAEDSTAVLLFDELDALLDREDFTGAMAALARLRAPVDAFFDGVVVNDPDPETRARRLALLAGVRAAMHRVADFAKIEG